jgi:hypothetical protein
MMGAEESVVHTDADVRAAIGDLWHAEVDRERVRALLAEYGVAAHEREVPRVRLAVLRLSAGQLEHVRELVGLAKRDYRDVLMWAEFPEEGRNLWTASVRFSARERNELSEIRKRGREQHAHWLSELRRRRTRG